MELEFFLGITHILVAYSTAFIFLTHLMRLVFLFTPETSENLIKWVKETINTPQFLNARSKM